MKTPFLSSRRAWIRGSCVFLFFAAAVGLSAQENRFALVIGNGAYEELSRLKNPANDARDVAEALRGLGVTVDLLVDATLSDMEKGVILLGSRLAGVKDAVGFFFYAGHGVQSGGVNYLIPADAKIPGESFLRSKALSVQSVLDTIQASANRLNIVILDACRDNPYSWSRSGSRGLSIVGSQPPGSIIAYATSAGSTARDGDGRNGVFTGELLRNLKKPGTDIFDVFRLTGAAVRDATGGEQIPAVYNQFFDRYYLAGAPAASQEKSAAPRIHLPASENLVRVEGGTFLRSEDKSANRITVGGFFIGRFEVTFDEFDEFCSDTGRTKPGDKGWGRGRRPAVNVSWYDAVQYCNWLSRTEGLRQVYSGSGKDLVCDFSANGYRLPTEAEWEFAAKGGERSGGYIYAGGNDPGAAAWYSANAKDGTHPVGEKQANELGIHDMSGNAWEWCWDLYGGYAAGQVTDPRGPETGIFRVIRGGSWHRDADRLATGSRGYFDPAERGPGVGFRIARSR